MMFGALPDPSASGSAPAAAPVSTKPEASWKAPPPADPSFQPQPTGPQAPAAPKVPNFDPHRGAPVRGLTMEMEAFEQSIKGRSSRLVWYVGGGVILAALAGTGYYLANRPKTPTPAMVARNEDSDPGHGARRSTSLQTAADGFAKLDAEATAQQIPQFYAPEANRLIALSFMSFDLRRQIQELLDRAGVIEKEIKHTQEKQESADWRARVSMQTDKLSQLKAVTHPLQERAGKLDEEESKLFKAMNEARIISQSPVPELMGAGGLLGSPRRGYGPQIRRALPQGSRRRVGRPDLRLGRGAAPPHRARLQVRAARSPGGLQGNPQLLRAKRLEAVIDLELKDYAGARSLIQELQLASTDDPDAKRMMAQVEAAEANSKTAAAPEAPPASPQPGQCRRPPPRRAPHLPLPPSPAPSPWPRSPRHRTGSATGSAEVGPKATPEGRVLPCLRNSLPTPDASRRSSPMFSEHWSGRAFAHPGQGVRMAWVFWISVGLLVHTYFLYPVILVAADAIRQLLGEVGSGAGPNSGSAAPGDEPRQVSVVIAADNEASCIGAKLGELSRAPLSQGLPRDHHRSVDRPSTEAIVAACSDSPGPPLRRGPGRQGRGPEPVYPAGSRRDCVLTDANTEVDPGAIRQLVQHFNDPLAGAGVWAAASSIPPRRSTRRAPTGVMNPCSSSMKGDWAPCRGPMEACTPSARLSSPSPTGHHRRRLRDPHADPQDGVSGSLRAAGHGSRRDHREPRPGGKAPSPDRRWDLSEPPRGGRAAAAWSGQELGGLQLWSQRMLRRLAPLLMATALVSNLALVRQGWAVLSLMVQAGFYTLALASRLEARLPRAIRRASSVAYYFASMNWALAVGLWGSSEAVRPLRGTGPRDRPEHVRVVRWAR